MVDQAEIHRMAQSEDAYWREEAAYQLFFLFKELPDKEQAWIDLCHLTNDKINRVRWSATEALGVAFPYIPDKLQAWNNLHRLTSDEGYIIRIFAAEAVGVAFAYVPDKEQAWDDLYRLTQDENRGVKTTAFISLGRASIFKATDAENKENFKKYMEDAISYFEKSLTQIFFSNPAKFCLPFYRSFYTLIFKTEDADIEVPEYLAEARDAAEGSESKEKLLEAVENLRNALKEPQNLWDKDFNAVKSDLNAYRRYCERACDLLKTTEEKAPGATRLIKKGLPIIDDKKKELLDEIRVKAEKVCKVAKTPEAEIGCRIGKNIAVSQSTVNPVIVDKRINYILNDFEVWSRSISDINEKDYIRGLIKDAMNEDGEEKLLIIRTVVDRLLIFSGDEAKNMTKIEIRNSSNVQIANGDGNIQKSDKEQTENKSGISI